MSATREQSGIRRSNMTMCQPRNLTTWPECIRPCARLSRAQRLLCVLAMAVCALPLSAQNGQYTPRFGMGHKPDVTVVPGSNVESNPVADDEKCFPWKLSGAPAATVSAARLKIPLPAKREYEKACDASSKNDYGEAEQHARGAIGKFQGYSAAWVMLGMSLEGQQKAQEARDACAHAAALDANYLPAYLCAAEISARNQDWKEVSNFADQALALKSDGNPYPNLYRAKAYLHLNNLVEAKKSVQQAMDMDANHSEPSIYFVLAQIYQREGDNAGAIAQLQELLKHNPDLVQEDMAKQLLTRLQSQSSTR